MDEDLLRIEIYKRLGLEIGSLSSESGNDWVRAKTEILDQFKREEFKNNNRLNEINYLTMDKEHEDFKSILRSNSLNVQDYKVLIAQRTDLTEDEISELVASGNKEVMINLTRCQILSPRMIDKILPNSVYLTKKNLIEKQNLSNEHKEILLNLMSEHQDTYNNLFEKFGVN